MKNKGAKGGGGEAKVKKSLICRRNVVVQRVIAVSHWGGGARWVYSAVRAVCKSRVRFFPPAIPVVFLSRFRAAAKCESLRFRLTLVLQKARVKGNYWGSGGSLGLCGRTKHKCLRFARLLSRGRGLKFGLGEGGTGRKLLGQCSSGSCY